jgi:hypothetical protein
MYTLFGVGSFIPKNIVDHVMVQCEYRYSYNYDIGYREGKSLSYIIKNLDIDYVIGFVSGVLDTKWGNQ